MRKVEAVSVRVDADAYRSLFVRHKACGQTLTGTLARLIAEEDARNPISFSLRRVLSPEGEHYELGLGTGASIWSGPTVDGAREALAAFRREHGLDPRRFPLSPEVTTLDLRDLIHVAEETP